MGAAEKLVEMFGEEDAHSHSLDELLPLQVKAIQERFASRRTEIPVLASRARDMEVAAVTCLEDAVPLLFSHTVYKSYPDSFITECRWDQMCQWLGMLTAIPIGNVDMSGVVDLDGWVERLWAAGHYVFASSGTTGKSSFVDQTEWERDAALIDFLRYLRTWHGIEARQDRAAFMLGPSRSAARTASFMNGAVRLIGRPEATYWLSDDPISIVEINRIGNLARAMAEGRATPGEVAENDRRARERQQHFRENMEQFVDALIQHRDEPAFFLGSWGQYAMTMEVAQARGLDEVHLHPDTAFLVGGGLKGANLTGDFQGRILTFFGLDRTRVLSAYGTSELTGPFFPLCSAERYHCPPWNVLFILDASGERLLNPEDGAVNGRLGMFDVLTESRWGGLITGDNVDAHFGRCECGRPGPTISNIVRYRDLDGADDKLTCAGTLDAYVRGVLDD